jgi:hypothetical protein
MSSSFIIVTSNTSVYLFKRISHDRSQEILDPPREVIRLDEGKAADLSVLFPGDDGELVPRLDIGLVPQFLGENHLAAFINADERLDLAGPLPGSGKA